MMLVRRTLARIDRKYLGGFLLLTVISIICVAFSMTGGSNLDFARREILLRRIGHELLLQSGDSTSRVLPVRRLSKAEYQVSFEHAFSFRPDSLVHITTRLLAHDPLASDYVVNVLNCLDSSVAYGYAISGKGKDDIISCLGRTQPKGCYLLSIKFGSAESGAVKNGYLLGGLALLALTGVIFLRRAKHQSVVPANDSPIPEDGPTAVQNSLISVFTLGSMVFDTEARRLTINEKTIDLTKTETRVLRIFAATPNETIERSRLQKEIWEDEGVIVGRSLDMFISKLRKKLESDPAIKLTVVRGKGYTLQISS